MLFSQQDPWEIYEKTLLAHMALCSMPQHTHIYALHCLHSSVEGALSGHLLQTLSRLHMLTLLLPFFSRFLAPQLFCLHPLDMCLKDLLPLRALTQSHFWALVPCVYTFSRQYNTLPPNTCFSSLWQLCDGTHVVHLVPDLYRRLRLLCLLLLSSLLRWIFDFRFKRRDRVTRYEKNLN